MTPRANRSLLIFVMLLTLVAPAFAPAQAQEGDDSPTPTPPARRYNALASGTYQGRITVSRVNRDYLLHVPSTYDPETPTPLVVAFHPYGSSPLEQALISGLSDKADEAGFLVMYPQALGDPPVWQVGSEDPVRQNFDLETVRFLIRALQEQLNIDPARIYLTGFSLGGGLVSELGCYLADIVAAIAPVSGYYPVAEEPQPCLAARPVPVIAFHGAADNVLPYEGVEGELTPVREWAAGWVEGNGCTATPTITFEEGEVTGETWSDCDDGADVALYTIEGFAHVWPRTSQIPDAPFEIPTATVNATDVIWDFFAAHPFPQTVSAATTAGFAPGDYFGSVENNGLHRYYMIHVPAGYDPGAPTPLVINYHGAGSTPHEAAVTSQMSAKADEAGFIVAYPEGLGTPRNWLFWANAAGDMRDDVGFTRALIADLAGRLNIDRARVYATGLSNGGGMANRVGCDLADVIAAFSQVAGTYPLPEGCNPARPVPVVAFHGTADDVLPYRGVPHGLLAAPDWAAHWAARNGCAPTPAVTFGEGVASGETWGGCLDGAEVTLYTIEGFGHRWPRTEPIPELPESTTTDIDATEVMWAFFAAHPMSAQPSAAVVVPEGEEEPEGEAEEGAGAEAEREGFALEPGDYVREVESGGMARNYILHIPPGYEAGAPAPLVLAYHGYGDSSVNFALASGLMNTADEAGFILAFPEGAGETRGWTALRGQEGPDDVQFTRDLIDALMGAVSIDPARIYITGFSNGGVMAYRLGCELADRVAAIAPVSGRYPESDACEPDRPLPIIAIHGDADSTVPYEGERGRSLPVEEWAGNWAARNGCDRIPTLSETTARFQSGEVAVTVLTWGDCDAGADVVLQTYRDWGHSWPRGAGADAIWVFFAAHPMPGAED